MPLVTSIARREAYEQNTYATSNLIFSSEVAENAMFDHEVHYYSYTRNSIQ